MLHTAPSFCIYNNNDGSQEENNSGDLVDGDGGQSQRCVTIGDNTAAMSSGEEFSFGKTGMGLIEERDKEEEEEMGKDKDEISNGFRDMGIDGRGEGVSPMYIAAGFGVDGDGDVGVGGVDFMASGLDGNDEVEGYLERLVREDPSNPLVLRDYAQLLKLKGDLSGAEDYSYRATLADSENGEILSQYAELIWELHHDKDRALIYFKRAAQFAPQHSDVLAAYARFLWEIDDDEEENASQNDHVQAEESVGQVLVQNSDFQLERPVSPPLYLAAGLGIHESGFDSYTQSINYSAANCDEGTDIEEYYKRIVEENPCNPSVITNYARFLYESKGEPQRAEEYYYRAILADPNDGEILSQYAKLTWELHHDKEKAIIYFERAAQSSPENSNVLAAYARFLWETEEDEEDNAVNYQ